MLGRFRKKKRSKVPPPELRLYDYRPRSMLRAPEHEIARGKRIRVAEAHGDVVRGPGPDAGNRGELRYERIVWEAAQRVHIQPAVRQPLRQVAECAYLPPREARLAQAVRIDREQLRRRGKMATKQGFDALERSMACSRKSRRSVWTSLSCAV